MDMTTEVRNNRTESRYELFVDGVSVGVADYRINGATVVFPHTYVVPSRRGAGLGEVLVRAALDDVRAAGRSVVAQCWFVAEFIDANEEYQDLVVA